MRLGIDRSINIRLEGNANSWTLKRFHEELSDFKRFIPFSITDDSLDPNAEVLFSGDNVTVSQYGRRYDTGESLEARLSRLQSLFSDILAEKRVKRLMFWLNSGFRKDDSDREARIRVTEFNNLLIGLYREWHNFTPSVDLIIEK